MRMMISAAGAVLLMAIATGQASAQDPAVIDVAKMPAPVQMMPPPPGAWVPADALASPIRTDADRARDEARQAEATLNFSGVRPGWKVADMIMGGGYFTRIFSAAVGPEGHVTAWQPAEFLGFQQSYRDALAAADALPNVDGIASPIGAPDFPAGLDLIFTAQNYHDLHLSAFPGDTAAKVNAAAFAALKPGGFYVVIDHQAIDGTSIADSRELHRIDSQAVIDEVEAAGFKWDQMAAALWNDDDPRTANVFDDSIKGRTSQFMIRFRKPE